MHRKLIHRKTLISMLFLGMTLMGIISYNELPLELLPNTELPFLVVQVNSFRNPDPEYTEREAIIPLEGAISSLEDIEKIESYADRRRSGITVYFKSSANMKYAYLRLQEKVDKIKSTLPPDFIVSVFKIDTEILSNMFMNLQVRGSGGLDRVRYIAEKEIIEPLSAVDGVVNVELFGGREKTIEIILDNEAAESYGITPGNLRSLLARNNAYKKFAGHVEETGIKYFVNVTAEFDDVNKLKNIVVNPDIPLLLKDVATIRFGVKDETSISRVNGKESVTIQIIRDNQANIIALSEEVHSVIDNLNQKLKSKDISLVIEFDASEILKINIDLIKELALIGGLLAVIILWFFLRYFRLVSVIALAIPISVLTSFFLFFLFDITLNSLTLVGMALAIGMLLDNSVVVLENIYRLTEKKKDPESAAVQGTKEVWRSILAATLTTITVFVPFIFADNFMVQILGYQIGVSIISTLIVSLFVALLLIPMVTHYFLSRRQKASGYSGFNKNRYANKVYFVFLKLAMRNPFTTIILTILIFFISLLSTLALSVNVSNEPELQDFNLYVTMAAGSSLELTDKTVSELEEMLVKIPEIEDIISQIYEEEAILSLKLKESFREIENHTIEDVKSSISEQINDFRAAEVSFEEPESSNRFSGGGGNRGDGIGGGMGALMGIGSSTESIVIKGQDMDLMLTLADDINYQLENMTSVSWSQVSVSEERPEIHMHPDRVLMDNSGVTMNEISNELSSFENEISSGLTFKADGEEYDIIISNEDYLDKDMDDLKNMKIQNQSGAEYELQDISRLLYGFGTSRISRVNQERQVNVRYRFQQEITETNAYLEEARSDVDLMVEGFVLPTGLAIEVIHDENDLSDFYLLIAAAALLVYMILASVFESLMTPFVIMLTIPLAGIGSLWAIIFTGNSLLNANTLIGFLILLGIVVNNGIILLDYTRILRQQGFNRTRALMVAGSARLRPIFITAISTIIAMLPLAMGRAEYVTQIAAPFAITVIGGLSFSTIFTLILIPTVYTALENTLHWIKSLSWLSKAIQAVLFAVGNVYIYLEIDSLIWSMIDFTLLTIVIPAATYFVTASLKRARTDLIPEDKPITITIGNLYKVYDLPGKFKRDWLKVRKENGIADVTASRQWQNLLMLASILIFIFYFVYIYLDSIFWFFVLSHLAYFFAIYFFKQEWLLLFKHSKIRSWAKAGELLYKIFVWGFPAYNLFLFVQKWDSLTTAIFAGLLWYITLSFYFSSIKIRNREIDVNRISGWFAGIRKSYYRSAEKVFAGLNKEPFAALNGVSLTIGKGMFGLLGPNGAGKTTLMRTICGVLDQSFGTIKFNEFDSKDHREELQGIIGYLPQEFGTYENMSAKEFLDYQAIMKGITDDNRRSERINYVLEAVHLQANSEEKIGSFSGGMKQRVGIAQSLLRLPRILVVDEPTAGLDPRERIRFRNLLVELSRDRIVIFSTHIIEDVSSSCDKVAVMNTGQVRYVGNPLEMAKLAENRVWQVMIDPIDFDDFQKEHSVTHHIRIEDKLRIRCLAEDKPHPDARQVKPILEDAYLWIAGSKNCGQRAKEYQNE